MGTEIVQAGFSYADIEDKDSRDKVREAAKDIRDRLKLTSVSIIEIGDRLIAVKDMLDHGQYGPWLETEFGFSRDTAENFVNVATNFRVAKQLRNPPPATSMYALSKASVPDAARAEAVQRARDGECITPDVAREIIARHKEKEARKKAKGRKAEDAPEVNGQSKVNGVVQDDPAEVAEARAKGRMAADVVPEVTVPEPGETTEPFQAPQQTDDEWLAALPLSKKLEGAALTLFQRDALDYRKFEPHRDTAKHHAARIFPKGKGRIGAYAFAVVTFLGKGHPKTWKACPKPDDGGCGGTGQVPTVGQCGKCHGRGYWL